MGVFNDILTALVQAAIVQASSEAITGFGSDLDCGEDLAETMLEASEARMLAQALLRRLTTPRGSVLDAPDYGRDVRAYLHKGLTAADLAEIPGAVRAEIMKDERVISAEVRAAFTNGVLRLTIQGASASGPFALVVAIDQAVARILEAR